MSFKGRVARGFKWQAFKIAGRQLLSLVVFTTLARLLDPAAFGLVALISVYSYFASVLADFGVGTALVQRQELEQAHLDAAFWFNLTTNGVFCLITVVFAHPLAVLLGDEHLVPLLRWSSLSLVITALSAVQATLFVKNLDFKKPTIRTLLSNAVGGLVGVVMALAGYGVWALVGQLLAASIAGTIFLCTASEYRPSWRFSYQHFRQLIGVGSSVVVNGLIWFVTSRLDQLVIGRYAGMTPLGLYVVGGKLPDTIKSATHQPIIDVSIPALAQLQNDHPKMCSVIYRGIELNALVMFPVFVGVAAVAHDLVPFLFGLKWQIASLLTSLLSLYALINILQVFFYPALLASGVTTHYVILNLLQATGVLGACALGVVFGIPWLVVGLIVNALIMSIPSILLLRKRIGLSPARYFQPCLFPALSCVIMTALVLGVAQVLPVHMKLVLRLAIEIATGAAVYISIMYMFRKSTLRNLFEMVQHAANFRKGSAGVA